MTKPSAFIKRIGKSTFNAEQVFYSIANLFSFSNPYVGSSSLQSSKKLTVVDSGNNYFELKMQRTVSLSKNELIPIIDLTINGRGDLLMEEGPYSIILINFIKNAIDHNYTLYQSKPPVIPSRMFLDEANIVLETPVKKEIDTTKILQEGSSSKSSNSGVSGQGMTLILSMLGNRTLKITHVKKIYEKKSILFVKFEAKL